MRGPASAMSYVHKRKWGALGAVAKRTFHAEPHMYSAPIASVREDGDDQPAAFWRSKTRCSSYAEWMELHDASDGAVMWRAEARYCDRSAPIGVPDKQRPGREKTEFLTVLRLYLENENVPRLMVVHRDDQPAGLKTGKVNSKAMSVYTLDPSGGTGTGSQKPGAAHQAVDEFDFATTNPGEEVFQILYNPTLTTFSLATLQVPEVGGFDEDEEEPHAAPPPRHVRTLARMKRPSEYLDRKLEVDRGLDVPLVSALLLAVDQLLVSHVALDYDVDWPEEYGFAAGECFSSRKKNAEGVSISELSTQTGGESGTGTKSQRACFCF